MKSKYCFFLFFLSPLLLLGQETESKWALKHSPQHFLVSTLRLELERVLQDGKTSLTAAPFFVSGDMWDNHPKDDIMGLGIELMGRVYFAKNNRNMKGFYASYGANYSYYKNHARTAGWREVEEDGLELIKYGDIEKDIEINRIGFLFLVGYQLNIRNTLIIDFYHGFGIKKSFSPQGKFGLDRYRNSFLDYSYSGLDPRLGVKIGFVL